MGYYIQTDARKGKADYLIKEHGAEKLDAAPRAFNDIPSDKVLVVVVDNGPFEAAGVAYDEREFMDFTAPNNRPMTYLLMDFGTAAILSGLPVALRSPKHNQ